MDNWADLNKRQVSYLKAVYETDQEVEKEEKSRFTLGLRSRPAEEWRWLMYATVNMYDTSLKGKIRHLKMIDEGTGSTFKALEVRGYILTKHEPNPPFEPLLYVRITPKGRKLIRTITMEERPKKLAIGTLREWHWRALGKAYEAYINGDIGVKGDGFGKYGEIGWNTWLHLREYKYQGYNHPLIEEHCINPRAYYELDNYCVRLTPFGIQYYEQEWKRYTDLYPDIQVPEPKV